MPRFEWDPAKATTNLAKHGVSFDAACRIWDDPRAAFQLPDDTGPEERWRGIGVVGYTTALFVVFVFPDPSDEETVRIISARKATPRERMIYAQAAP